MIIDTIRSYSKKLLKICTARDREDAALSCALATYIAISPFVGLHTILVFVSSWYFKLNPALLLILSCTINNPWTMVPIYLFDHFVGLMICNLFGIDPYAWNPQMLVCINNRLQSVLGTGISIWAFIIGGNVVALTCGVATYVAIWFLMRKKNVERS